MRTQTDIEAELAELYAAKRRYLTGGMVTEVTHASGGVKKQAASLEEINQAIAMLELELAKVTGMPSRLGPVRFGFGSRT